MVAHAYRRLFVNLDKIADFLDEQLSNDAKVLDIGGGDGALVERLLIRRPDLTITMCDRAAAIGSFLSDQNRARVRLLPATDFTEVGGSYDFVTISDVIHHVPVDQREGFFRSLAESCDRWACQALIFKDIEPSGARGALALIADRYITGDRHVVFFSRLDFADMARRYFPTAHRVSSVPDWPNYCEVLKRRTAASVET